jgi:hypothetical protein
VIAREWGVREVPEPEKVVGGDKNCEEISAELRNGEGDAYGRQG